MRRAIALTLFSAALTARAECAGNLDEFKRSPRLIAALGAGYNAWVKWKGDRGGTFIGFDQNGRQYLDTGVGKRFGFKDRPFPMRICIDSGPEASRVYLKVDDKSYPFDDDKANQLTLGNWFGRATYTREAGAGELETRAPSRQK